MVAYLITRVDEKLALTKLHHTRLLIKRKIFCKGNGKKNVMNKQQSHSKASSFSSYQHQFHNYSCRWQEVAIPLVPCNLASLLLPMSLRSCRPRCRKKTTENRYKTYVHKNDPKALLIVQDNIGTPNMVAGHVQHLDTAILARIPFQFVVIPRLLHPKI